jgi:hypothetical protein
MFESAKEAKVRKLGSGYIDDLIEVNYLYVGTLCARSDDSPVCPFGLEDYYIEFDDNKIKNCIWYYVNYHADDHFQFIVEFTRVGFAVHMQITPKFSLMQLHQTPLNANDMNEMNGMNEMNKKEDETLVKYKHRLQTKIIYDTAIRIAKNMGIVCGLINDNFKSSSSIKFVGFEKTISHVVPFSPVQLVTSKPKKYKIKGRFKSITSVLGITIEH